MRSCPRDPTQTARVRRCPRWRGKHGICGRLRPFGKKMGEGGEVKFPCAEKGCVAPHPVNRDSQEFRVVVVKLRQKLVVERDLITAYRAPVCRVEGDDDVLSLEIRQSQVLIGRYPQREIRSGSAGT